MTNTEIWARYLACLRNKINDGAFSYVAAMTCDRMDGNEWVVCLPDRSSFNYVEATLYDKLVEVQHEVLEDAGVPSQGVGLRLLLGEPVSGGHVVGYLPGFDERLHVSDVSSMEPRQQSRFRVSNGTWKRDGVRMAKDSQHVELSVLSVEIRRASHLNERYRFDSFIQGNSNDVALAAARAVAANPGGTAYNPLFLYGGVGLGKTHLMQAIGNEIIELRSQSSPLRVRYMPSEEFYNGFIAALGNGGASVEQWRKKLRESYDVLLIDDIQFIAGKDATQQEFFHTFNYLIEADKQVVLTSDKHPSEIAALEARMRSRFGGGGTFDIQLPDYETRFAILKQKAAVERTVLPDDAASYIASKVATNVRELEGCFNRIRMNAIARKVPISLDIVRRIVDPLYQTRKTTIDADDIIACVGRYFGLSREELLSKARPKPLVYPRQIAMYLMRVHTSMSFPDIGRVMQKDHSTIMSGVNKIVARLDCKDTSLQYDVKRLEEELLRP